MKFRQAFIMEYFVCFTYQFKVLEKVVENFALKEKQFYAYIKYFLDLV